MNNFIVKDCLVPTKPNALGQNEGNHSFDFQSSITKKLVKATHNNILQLGIVNIKISYDFIPYFPCVNKRVENMFSIIPTKHINTWPLEASSVQ